MNKKITPTLFLLMLILIFSSCSGEGIFYNIQNEVKIIDKGLPNVKFLDVHNTDPSTSGGYYIARGVKLWYRSKSVSSAWTKIDMPSGADAIQSSAMYNTAFYYTVKTGDSAALYRVDNADTTAPGAGTRVFTVSPGTSGNYVVLQLYANEDSGQDRIFLNTIEYNRGDPVSSALSYDNTGANGSISVIGDLASCAAATLGNKPIRTKGMAFGSGGNTWLITNDGSSKTAGGNLYFSNDNFVGDNNSVSMTDGWYEAIYAKDLSEAGTGPDIVMVSVKNDTNNLIYNDDYDGAGAWRTQDTGDAFLSCFAWADSLVTNYIVAGTKKDTDSTSYAKGIYLINANTPSSMSVAADGGTLADSANYSSSDLRNSSIYGIMVDDSTKSVLAATSKDSSNGGIWFLNGISKLWNHE